VQGKTDKGSQGMHLQKVSLQACSREFRAKEKRKKQEEGSTGGSRLNPSRIDLYFCV